jgi:hypothetical protein
MAERRLTAPEQRVLDTIYESFRTNGAFPIYQWIDTELDASGIDAEATLKGLPTGLVLVPSRGGVLSREDLLRPSSSYGMSWVQLESQKQSQSDQNKA